MSSEDFGSGAGFNSGKPGVGVRPWRRPALLTAIGCLALALGTVVYLTDRGASHAMLPAIPALAGSRVFGSLGLWLPSFVHPFSFSLFTAAVLPDRSAARTGACVAWAAVDVAFEVGQHPLVSARLVEALHGIPGATPLARYFAHGTFDLYDVLAALSGALTAAVVLQLTQRVLEKAHAQ